VALTQQGFMTLNVRFMDRDRNTSTVGFRFSALADLTAFIAAVPATLIPALGAISDAEIVGWSLAQGAVDPDVPGVTVPAETSDVERKGVWSLKTDNGYPVVLEIPSIDNTLVIDGSNLINRSAAAVIAFENILNGTVLLGTSNLVSNRDEEVNQVVKAEKRHRGSTRG
jgi:hypothetical protein